MTPSLYSVAIFVHDLPSAVGFYRDALGLPLTRQGSFGAEFLEGPTRLSVHPAVHSDARALVGRHTGVTLHIPGLLHYCGDLHARGVRFVAEPTQQSWGIMAMVADPEGNILALWEDQLPDTAEHSATEPSATEPSATEPAATEPAATEPAATEPAATEPALSAPQHADQADGTV